MALAKHKFEIADEDLLEVFEDLKAILNGYNPAWIEQESGVTDQTIYNWLQNKTRKPRLDTITKVAKVVGYKLTLVKEGPHLRSVK